MQLKDINITTIVDSYGIDFELLKKMIKSAQTGEKVTITKPKKQKIKINPSIGPSPCELPPKLKVWVSGLCRPHKKHEICPNDSRWCYYCMKNVDDCYAKKRTRKKGEYSFKIKK